jgi:hypothetical protein
MRSKSGAIKVVPFKPLKDTSRGHYAKTLYRLKLFAAGRYFERPATIQELILLALHERVTASSASAFCYHGKRKKDCRLCSPQYFCDFHGRPRKTCKECNGGGALEDMKSARLKESRSTSLNWRSRKLKQPPHPLLRLTPRCRPYLLLRLSPRCRPHLLLRGD